MYDENIFRREGINVYNLEYLDGSCPDDVKKFNQSYLNF
jgi:hypothetical protein